MKLYPGIELSFPFPYTFLTGTAMPSMKERRFL
nr:MAG TPA: hypothetical protein [Caudoviricetes sp.]